MHITRQTIGGEVGRGRSGVVYFGRDELGREVVEKIFGGDTASKLVLYTLTGAPNPYIWNQHAITCAVARRRILGHLVQHWFGQHLSLPRTDGSSWNEKHHAFALHCEFIRGRHVPLRLAPPLPKTDPKDPKDPLTDLRFNIMKPLQKLLQQSGFDGLVWQAGRGNPVATNNFMLMEGPGKPPGKGVSPGKGVRDLFQATGDSEKKVPDTFKEHARHHWVWIDLESGVPALFPANPLTLFSFYLPASFKHRRPMFDDVDLPKLEQYLATLHHESPDAFDASAIEEMNTALSMLKEHQTAWKALGRTQRSIEAARVVGKLTDEQAAWFRRHRLVWMARLLVHGLVSATQRIVQSLGSILKTIRLVIGRVLGPNLLRFISSQRFRTRLSRRLVSRRIGVYELRGQLLRDDARQFRRELRNDESTEYITDFGIHLSFKPLVKTTQWTLVPILLAYGMITPFTGLLMLAFIGPIFRTIYTLGRTVQASSRRQPLPLVALFVGMLPSVGTLAYPAQLAWAAEHYHRLARFIIDDTFATLGRKLPIWGGPDSYTEHFFNRMPAKLSRWLPKPKRKPKQEEATSPAHTN